MSGCHLLGITASREKEIFLGMWARRRGLAPVEAGLLLILLVLLLYRRGVTSYIADSLGKADG